MTKCKICGKDMKSAAGCIGAVVVCNEEKYQRIRVRESDCQVFQGVMRCMDCNALSGKYHHFGCDIEVCPACGGQLRSCNCKGVRLIVEKGGILSNQIYGYW